MQRWLHCRSCYSAAVRKPLPPEGSSVVLSGSVASLLAMASAEEAAERVSPVALSETFVSVLALLFIVRLHRPSANARVR